MKLLLCSLVAADAPTVLTARVACTPCQPGPPTYQPPCPTTPPKRPWRRPTTWPVGFAAGLPEMWAWQTNQLVSPTLWNHTLDLMAVLSYLAFIQCHLQWRIDTDTGAGPSVCKEVHGYQNPEPFTNQQTFLLFLPIFETLLQSSDIHNK